MVKASSSMKNKVLIIGIIILGLILRLLFFKSVTFFYDQARDAFSAMNIWQGDPIKVLGPTSDIPGVNHGPLYWYIISPTLAISDGNILYAKVLLILINLLGIYFIYDLSKNLFKNKAIALTSSFLYAISFEAVAYGRWLSNPNLALITIAISFWSLWKFIQGKKWAFITLLISWGLSIQFEIFMVYQIIVFIVIWLALQGQRIPKISTKVLIYGIFGFLAAISTYILAEIKFHFQATIAIFNFLSIQKSLGQSFVGMFNSYIERLVNIFYLNFWGINLFFAGLMAGLILLIAFQKTKSGEYKKEFVFLLIWLFSPVVINFFSGPNSNFVSLGALFPAIIVSSFFLNSLAKKWKVLMYVAFALIIFSNLNLILSKNKEGDVLFTVQKQMILKDELSVIDWTYKEAGGKPFKLNTYTQPIFINSTWAYLFNWYGKSTYGYMPIWWGEKQVDVAGANVKFADETATNFEFFIIEPGATGDDNFLKAVKILENGRSKVVKTERIGYFTVEEREITNNFTFTSGDVFRVIKGTDLRELQKVQ